MPENEEIIDITPEEIERNEAIAEKLDKQDENLALIRKRATALDAAVGRNLQKAAKVKTITIDRIEKTIDYGSYSVAIGAIERIIDNPDYIRQISLELLSKGETIDEFIARMCAKIIANKSKENRIADLKAMGEDVKPKDLRASTKTSQNAALKAMNIERLEKKLRLAMTKMGRVEELRTCGMNVLLEREAMAMFNRPVDSIKAQRLVGIAANSNDGGTAMAALKMIDEQRRMYPHIPPRDRTEDNITLSFTNYLDTGKERKEIKITRGATKDEGVE